MNRPNTKKTIDNDEKPYRINPEYVHDLEKYCDELEREVKLKEHQRQNWEHDFKGIESYYIDCLAQRDIRLNEWVDECHEAWDEVDKYKTALNRVCNLLAGNNDWYCVGVMTFDKNGNDCEIERSVDEWKDWAFTNNE